MGKGDESPHMRFRKYDEKKDRKAIFRIFVEVGWLDEKRDKKRDRYVDAFITASAGYVAVIRDEAECFVMTSPGSIRYRDAELRLCAVTGVTTSRIARKMNSATRLTAMALAEAAKAGDCVAGLGVFDQGFYNKLGFGNGPYQQCVAFDPSSLEVESLKRVPFRLGLKDAKKMHASRLSRMRGHGSICILPFEQTQDEIAFSKTGFGLGFFDERTGELTHHLWIKAKGNHGPYTVYFMSYRTYDQLLELLSLLKSFGDQVYVVEMQEPPEIQLQDLLRSPFRYQEITRRTKYENHMSAEPYYQVRMLNLWECVEKTSLLYDGLRFNLSLKDPIKEFLPEGSGWMGLSGEYTITFGKKSSVASGKEKGLSVLKGSVGAFTRMWMGVRSASALSATDELEAPGDLLKELDDLFLSPAPMPDWDF